MTRRSLLTLAFGRGNDPYVRWLDVANAANDFNRAYTAWTKPMNEIPHEAEGISYAEAITFEPLPKLWRTFERLRTRWIKQSPISR